MMNKVYANVYKGETIASFKLYGSFQDALKEYLRRSILETQCLLDDDEDQVDEEDEVEEEEEDEVEEDEVEEEEEDEVEEDEVDEDQVGEEDEVEEDEVEEEEEEEDEVEEEEDEEDEKDEKDEEEEEEDDKEDEVEEDVTCILQVYQYVPDSVELVLVKEYDLDYFQDAVADQENIEQYLSEALDSIEAGDIPPELLQIFTCLA
jgi:hypothetical protein